MNHLVVGRGEIGEAVIKLLNTKSGNIYTYDMTGGYSSEPKSVDTLHICFPHSEYFVPYVNSYAAKHRAKHIIIWSTVPIGTTRQIKKAVHSPVEGRHPHLFESVQLMMRWLGCNKRREAKFWEEFFDGYGLSTHVVDSSNYTEALKLLSTAEYGINLVFADYRKYVCDKIEMPYELTMQWNWNYNVLYQKLGMPQFQKFVLTPPRGKIGGHCVVPNAKLLDDEYPDPLLGLIKGMEVIGE